MSPEFLPEAEEEFREAVQYYESKAAGVGVTFITEVRKAITMVTENPCAAVAVGSGIRKKVMHHFPYNILYAVEEEVILTVAVAHQKRRPTYWRKRVKQVRERKERIGT